MNTTCPIDGKKILSVIIAAYNVEEYIDRCLRSVVEQCNAASHLRIVVVLDGPTDSTAARTFDFVQDHGAIEFSIIEQRNQGLAAARQVGVRAATTDYITFLDADDFWLQDYLPTVLKTIEEEQPDIIEYDALITDPTGYPKRLLRSSSGPRGRFELVTADDYLAHFKNYWIRVFRRSLFDGVIFPLGQRFEDTAVMPLLYSRACRIVSLGTPLLAYRQHPASIVARPSIDDVISLNEYARAALERYADTGDDYWTRIAMRTFQQACARVIMLPVGHWPKATRLARRKLVETLNTSNHPVRVLQVRFTLLYVVLLFAKRRLFDPFINARQERMFRKASKGYGISTISDAKPSQHA